MNEMVIHFYMNISLLVLSMCVRGGKWDGSGNTSRVEWQCPYVEAQPILKMSLTTGYIKSVF